MKVALVVAGGVDRSGTHRVIPALLALIRRLAHRCELHVFALRQEPEPSRYSLLGAAVHNIGSRVSRWRALAAIAQEHRRSPFHVLHAVWAVPCGDLAAVAGRLLRTPVLLHIFGGELAALPDIAYGGRCTRRGRLAVRLALRGASRIAALSAPLQETIEAMGYQAERLPLGVDPEAWPPRVPRPRDPGRLAALLHVGSLNRVKDQATLLRAAALLAGNGLEFTLDVAGEDTLAGEVQRTARALGVAGRVRFHGFLTHDRLRPLAERSDLLIVSSRHEAGPAVVREAATVGVATVGTAVGYVGEWAPEAAVAVAVGDAAALARAIAALLAVDARRLAVACEARDRAVREDADWSAERVMRIYGKLAGGGTEPAGDERGSRGASGASSAGAGDPAPGPAIPEGARG